MKTKHIVACGIAALLGLAFLGNYKSNKGSISAYEIWKTKDFAAYETWKGKTQDAYDAWKEKNQLAVGFEEKRLISEQWHGKLKKANSEWKAKRKALYDRFKEASN